MLAPNINSPVSSICFSVMLHLSLLVGGMLFVKSDIPIVPEASKINLSFLKISSGEKKQQETIRPQAIPQAPKPLKQTFNKKLVAERKVLSPTVPISPVQSPAATNSGAAISSPVKSSGVSYEQLIISWLSRHKQYPERARKKGIVGNGSLLIAIGPNGKLKHVSVDKSTGYTVLDQELEQMAARANPFPVPPADYTGSLTFLIPISFELR